MLRPLTLATLVAAAASTRRVLVTGANKGIGLQICKKIVQTVPDAHVLLGSRNQARGEKAVEDVLASDASAAGRVELVVLDVTDDASIAAAAKDVAARFSDESTPLFGICNNAGIGFGKSITETLATNFFGTVNVCKHFIPLVDPDGGRVCNVASASGPNFVRGLDGPQKTLFTSRETTYEELEAELERYKALTGACRGRTPRRLRAHPAARALRRVQRGQRPPPCNHLTVLAVRADYEGIAYGLSKAAVNQWTMQLAAANPTLKVNSCSPGYILTDLTKGMGATTRPEASNCHVAPLHLLFGDVEQPAKNLGRYYGSDAVRSPIDVYRGPGDPPYIGD